jgi:hypothetical protein
MGAIGGITRRIARRSRWLAERLWLVALAQVGWTSWRHWRRLEPDERRRLVELARKSRGRPSRNLSERERDEAAALLDKLGHAEFAGSIARTLLPFRPLGRIVEAGVRRATGAGRRRG